MSYDKEITGKVLTGYTGAAKARVVDWFGEPVLAADVSAVSYSVYSLDTDGNETAVTGHQSVSLTVADVFDAALVENDDAFSPNGGRTFHHVPDPTTALFSVKGTTYRIKYEVTLVSGGPTIPIRFKLLAV